MSMNLSKEAGGSELLYVGFNQDYACFACGTDNGFRIYNCNPFRETFRRDFQSGIGIVEMLFRCNILALVGGGRNPRYPPDKVMLWDDHQKRCIGELSFRSEVKQVKLRRDRVVVVLQNKIYVYNFADLKLIDHIETCNNPKGLCALSPSTTSTVLAFPALLRGHVRVELYGIRKSTFIQAHESDLACLALNVTGSRLATASDKGTLIRIFDTNSGARLQELRRGTTTADVYSLCFNPDTTMIATTSNHSTCHIFKLNEDACGSKVEEPARAGGSARDGGATSVAASPAAPASAARAASSPAPASGTASARPAAGTAGAGAGAGAGASGGGGSGAAATAPSPTTESKEGNTMSSLWGLRNYLPKYFASEWNFAKCKAPDGVRTICAFGSDPNTVILVGADGSFSQFNFEAGGDAKRVSYSRFMGEDHPEDDD